MSRGGRGRGRTRAAVPINEQPSADGYMHEVRPLSLRRLCLACSQAHRADDLDSERVRTKMQRPLIFCCCLGMAVSVVVALAQEAVAPHRAGEARATEAEGGGGGQRTPMAPALTGGVGGAGPSISLAADSKVILRFSELQVITETYALF